MRSSDRLPLGVRRYGMDVTSWVEQDDMSPAQYEMLSENPTGERGMDGASLSLRLRSARERTESARSTMSHCKACASTRRRAGV
jgi:hypothetical protein